MFNLMRNDLSHTVVIHIIRFPVCGICKIVLYTVLQSAVDGDVLLLPTRVRYVENSRFMVAYTMIYSSANNTECYYICQCQRYARFMAIHVCSSKIRFPTYKSSLSEKPEIQKNHKLVIHREV